MRALIITTGRLISPFLEPPGEALYGDTSVQALQISLLQKRGLAVEVVAADEVVPVGAGPVVVLADHCFVSEKALGDFLAAAFDVVSAGRSTRLALAKTPSV